MISDKLIQNMRMRKTIGAYLFLAMMTNQGFAQVPMTTSPERANPRYQECRNIVEGIRKLNDPNNHQRDLSNLTNEIKSLDVAQPKLFSSGYAIVVGRMSQYMNNGPVGQARDNEAAMLVCEEYIEDQINPRVRSEGSAGVLENVNMARQAQTKQFTFFSGESPLNLSSCLQKLMSRDFSLENCDPNTPVLGPQPVPSQFVSDITSITSSFRNTSSPLGMNFGLTNTTPPLNLPGLSLGFNSLAPSPDAAAASVTGFLRPHTSPERLKTLGFLNLRKPYSTDECNCAQETYDTKMANVGDLDKINQRKQVTDSLNQVVNKALGDKFKNKFTANFEDLNFFMSNNGEVFPNTADALKLQCANGSSFASAVQARCGSVSSADRDARLQAILGVPFSGLDSKLKEIGLSTVSIPVPGQTNPDGTPKLFTRDELDAQRLVLLKDSKELKFMDQMILKILKNPEMNKKVMDDYADPSDTIYHLIGEMLRNNPEDLTLLDADIIESRFGKKLKEQVTAANKDPLVGTLQTSMSLLLVTHPGLKAALKNKENLVKFTAAMNGSEQTSAWKLLEEQKSFLNEDFARRCDEMKQDMAMAVCTPADELLKNAPAHEIESLMSSMEPQPDQAISQQIICENRSANAPVLKDLVIAGLNPNERSDTTTRSLTPPGFESSDYLTMGMKRTLNGSPLQEYSIRQLRDAGRHRVSVSGTERIGSDVYARNSGVMQYDPSFERKAGTNTFVARQNNPSTSAKNNQTAPVQTTPVVARTEKVEAADNVIPGADVANVLRNVAGQGNNAVANNVAIPSTVNMATQSNDRRDETARSELREALSNNDNKDNVDRLVSNTDDSSVLELLRLKEEGAQNRLKILELANQNEKAQNEELERKLKKLQEKRSKAVAALNDEDDESSEEAGPQRRTNQGRREQSRSLASTTQSSDQSEVVGSAGTQPGKLSAPVPVNLQGLRNAVLPSNASLVNSGVRGPLVVNSKASKVAGIEIKPAEMNLELLNYLSENQADINTLLKIKDSGMLYRYQVVENGNVVDKEILVAYGSLNDDVKKLIDEKISQSGVQGAKIVEMDKEILRLQRAHSYAALKIILGEQLRNGTNR